MDEYLSEKEQWERVVQWLREQGPWVLVSVSIVLAGYYGWNYWRGRLEQRYVTAATRYEAVLQAFRTRTAKGEPDFDTGLKLTDQLVKDYPSSGYADQASLLAAAALVERHSLDRGHPVEPGHEFHEGSGAGIDRAVAACAGAAFGEEAR